MCFEPKGIKIVVVQHLVHSHMWLMTTVCNVFVFEGDKMQIHRHLLGHLCLPSSLSVPSRDVFMVGVASERPSIKKIIEGPKALL